MKENLKELFKIHGIKKMGKNDRYWLMNRDAIQISKKKKGVLPSVNAYVYDYELTPDAKGIRIIINPFEEWQVPSVIIDISPTEMKYIGCVLGNDFYPSLNKYKNKIAYGVGIPANTIIKNYKHLLKILNFMFLNGEEREVYGENLP